MTDLQLYLSTKAGSDLTFDGLEIQAWSLAKSVISAAESQQVGASEEGDAITLYLEPEGTVRISRFPREHVMLVDFEMTSRFWPTTVDTLREINFKWEDDEVTLIVGEAHPDTGHLADTVTMLMNELWDRLPANRQPSHVWRPALTKRLDPNQLELPLF